MMDKDDASKKAMHHNMDHDEMKPGDMAHEGMEHDGMGHGGMGHGVMGPMMDANHDGKVAAAEHAAAASSMFARIDANRDGYVTRSEFDAGMKIMPGAH